jgi:endoribonuclease Dicer
MIHEVIRLKADFHIVLDMVVTDYLYHAPGKRYKPSHIHLRKSAVVNIHFLAYICLRCSLIVDASMPRPNEQGDITVYIENQTVYLWQCLLHSSPQILDDFNNTFARYQKNRDEIENALKNEKIFPWAALTRLQAPKLFSDMIESLLGAIYLDSKGNISVVRSVLKTLGILPILERIVQDDVDILHPVSRLAVWASRQAKRIEYVFEKDQGTGSITCLILLDGKEEFRVTDTYRGGASQNEVKFAAAEKAIRELHLREREQEKEESTHAKDEE